MRAATPAFPPEGTPCSSAAPTMPPPAGRVNGGVKVGRVGGRLLVSATKYCTARHHS